MFQHPSGSNNAPESPEVHNMRGWPSGPEVSQSVDYVDDVEKRTTATTLQSYRYNTKALVSRFVQLVSRPADLAPLVLSIYSLSLSLLPSRRLSGVDFLYPMSSLTKRRSGRLARLILEHSKNVQQRNLHEATAVEKGFDPPRVAVIDLNEVSWDVIERGYSVPADIHGFVILIIILEALLALYLYILAPINITSKHFIGRLVKRWLGEEFFVFWANWGLLLGCILLLSIYAILRGDGILTLVQRSGPIAPGYAVFLDREFTAILTGKRAVVEAVVESGFSISYPTSWMPRDEISQLGRYLPYEMLKALCNGLFLTLLVGSCLVFHPSSLLTASVPLVPTMLISGVWSISQFQELPKRHERQFALPVIFACVFMPSCILFLAYELVVGEPLFDGMLEFGFQMLFFLPLIPFAILLLSSHDSPIHTTKFLDVLGNPPVRRWEFNTLAAAATFQCLILCRDLTCPIKAIDVLALLDIFVPDQTDVWMAWKHRVADRITREVEMLFAPTLPTFGDQRQERLKELLDQAQIGYSVYRNFCDRHLSLYRSESLL